MLTSYQRCYDAFPVLPGMNLFNRVILQSGSALSPWAMAADPVRSAKDLADSLNCLPVPEEGEPIDTKVMVNCLSEVGHEEMMNADVPYNRVSHVVWVTPTN